MPASPTRPGRRPSRLTRPLRLLPLLVGALPLSAQTAERPTPFATLRLRGEAWDWFDAGTEGRYAFGAANARVGARQQRARLGWQLELAAPLLLGLPDDATVAAPGGQLGMGASYAAANGGRRDVAGLFVKQAFVRLGRAEAAQGMQLRVGRFEFADGGERTPRDRALATLRQQRVNERLLGAFGFTHGQRSFDGMEVSRRSPAGQVTVLAARPTTGVFDVDGAGSLPVDVVYAAWGRDLGGTERPSDLRLFVLRIADDRGTVPTDSRPAAVRAAASREVTVSSIGGHWSHRRRLRGHDLDLLVWGARQFGDWGGLEHRAGALAVELGLTATRGRGAPFLRIGAVDGSGDDDPTDGTHGTFSQGLPTPRPFALFPFHNLQNVSERFVTLGVRPHATVAVRGGAHALRLRRAEDLWYLGGGASDRRTFGYAGRPSGGQRDMGSAIDLTVEWRPARTVGFTAFASRASGGDVMAAAYGGRRAATLLLLETTLRY